MLKYASLILGLIGAFAAGGIAQQVTPEKRTPGKTNTRPTPTPEVVKGEPFDKADVKTMAAQCVALDTEAGIIELELFPESAPESVGISSISLRRVCSIPRRSAASCLALLFRAETYGHVKR